MRTIERSPLHAGLSAARANFWPGVLIWSVMAGVVVAYYQYPPAEAVLEIVAEWKRQWSYAFSFAATGLAGGVIPELLRVVLLQRSRVRRENVSNILFGFPFWGFLGCTVDAFYRLQALWFGAEATPGVLVKKVLVDQFIFTPLWGTSSIVWAYTWRSLGFRPGALRGLFTFSFYRTRVFPSLIAGWGVWIPAVTIVYSLPTLLQVPLFVLATCFWSLIVTYIAAMKGHE